MINRAARLRGNGVRHTPRHRTDAFIAHISWQKRRRDGSEPTCGPGKVIAGVAVGVENVGITAVAFQVHNHRSDPAPAVQGARQHGQQHLPQAHASAGAAARLVGTLQHLRRRGERGRGVRIGRQVHGRIHGATAQRAAVPGLHVVCPGVAKCLGIQCFSTPLHQPRPARKRGCFAAAGGTHEFADQHAPRGSVHGVVVDQQQKLLLGFEPHGPQHPPGHGVDQVDGTLGGLTQHVNVIARSFFNTQPFLRRWHLGGNGECAVVGIDGGAQHAMVGQEPPNGLFNMGAIRALGKVEQCPLAKASAAADVDKPLLDGHGAESSHPGIVYGIHAIRSSELLGDAPDGWVAKDHAGSEALERGVGVVK